MVLYRVTAITVSRVITFLRRHRLIAASALLLVLFPACRFSYFLLVPPGKGGRVEIVDVGRGRPLRALASDMEARGILSSARLFTIYARLRGGDSRIKAGPYEFSDGMRPGEILDRMVSGEFYQRLFAVPEGYSSYQVAEMLEKRGLFPKESFLQACRDPELLREAGIEATSAEGYLSPGSYNIIPGRTVRDVVREMVQRQREVLKETLRKNSARMSPRELLTLASMVEKEATLPAEKPLIAAVFSNRLRKGMKLQSDPTALYGVRAFSGGKVTREDILRPTPYNTYLIPGLPPGPIGNPGKDAMEAVLNHPAVPYLFFVARRDGSHQFSDDLASHNEAVRRYLKTSGAAPAGSGR